MKNEPDMFDDAWLAKLDAIAAGEKASTANDDELLHLADRLARTLAPLKQMDRATVIHRQQLRSRLRIEHIRRIHKPVPRLSLLLAALLLFMLIIGMMNTGTLLFLWQNAANVWYTSTSLDQIQGLTVNSLQKPHPGLKPLPLLPSTLPGDTQASSYGVVTDSAHPNLLTTFVADYHIAGQDVLLYEQPSDLPYISATGQSVHINSTIEGQLFQDDTGTHALQWYQHGMICQVTSKLPVPRLVALASIFQPIKSWELIL